MVVYVDRKWCLLVSDAVFYSLMLSGDVRRVFEEFCKWYLSAVYRRVEGLSSSEGVPECSCLVWYIQQMLYI